MLAGQRLLGESDAVCRYDWQRSRNPRDRRTTESGERIMLQGKRPPILSATERDGVRAAGRFNGQLLDFVRPHIQPGTTTSELDKLVYTYTMDHGHTPACLGYMGFPKSCCTSVNEVVCHGIPGDYRLRDGDIVNLDLTTNVDGWLGDQSETFLIGRVSDEARRLTQCAFDCLYLAIGAIRPGGRVADIGRVIVEHAHEQGFSVVREYVGHGIGRQFHQEPTVPHYPSRQAFRDFLYPGVCFTIEPMINAGSRETMLDSHDGWTVRTRDGKPSAQFEHTILMTESGPEILTPTQLGPAPGHRF